MANRRIEDGKRRDENLLGEVVEDADDGHEQLRFVGVHEARKQRHDAVLAHQQAVAPAPGTAVERQ